MMVLMGACSFGILSTCVKLANQAGYGAAELASLQAAFGCLTLSGISYFKNKRQLPFVSLDIKSLLFLLLTGCCIGTTTFVYYLSVTYLPASLAIVILMQFTWLVILIERLFFKVKLGRSFLVLSALILCGTILASGIFRSKQLPAYSISGIILAFISALLYAVYTVASSKVKCTIGVLPKSALIMAGSTFSILLLNVNIVPFINYGDIHLLKWGAFLSLFGTIIPPILFTKGIPKTGAALSAMLMTAESPVAILCAHFVLNEPVNNIQWLGISIMILAVIWMNVKRP